MRGNSAGGEGKRLDLAASIRAAGRADAVRLLGRAALRAGRKSRRLDRMRGAPLVTARLGGLPLRDGHSRHSLAEVVFQRLQSGPARVAVLSLVEVRLVVQVDAAERAEARAVV